MHTALQTLPPTRTPAEWQRLCESVCFAAAAILHASGRTPSSSSVIEIVRQLPRNIGGDIPEGSLLHRCFEEASGHADAWRRRHIIDAVRRSKEFVLLCQTDRDMIEACVIGALLGFGMG